MGVTPSTDPEMEKLKTRKKRKTSKKHQKRRRRGPGPLLKDAACKIMYYSSGIMHLRRFGRQFCSKTSENHKNNMCFSAFFERQFAEKCPDSRFDAWKR